jgi:hypothetical protein
LEGQRLQTQFTKQIEAKTKPMHQLVYVILVKTKSHLDYKIQLHLNQITNTLIMISKPRCACQNYRHRKDPSPLHLHKKTSRIEAEEV